MAKDKINVYTHTSSSSTLLLTSVLILDQEIGNTITYSKQNQVTSWTCTCTCMYTCVYRCYGYNRKYIAMLLVTEGTVNNEFPESQPEWSPGPVGGALPHPQHCERERGEE